MDNILEANGLVKRYPTLTLDNISFSLPEGCVTGFIGASGAGKIATIHFVLNLTHKEPGIIEIFGLDVDKHEREIKDRLGIIMDGNYFYDGLFIEDMKSVAAPAYFRWNDVEYRIYMEKLDLDPRQKIFTLSSGTKTKFALVLALSHQAELLTMDKPTDRLDPFVRRQSLGIIMDYMKNGGKGAFFSTHITSDLGKVADVLILIDGGEIVFQQSKGELLNTSRIIKGSVALLNGRNKRLIRSLEISTYEFSALTGWIAGVKKEMPGVLFEKANVEDIVLAYVGGRSDGR